MIMFYFSGTGNSRYLAESFCEKTKSTAYSIESDVDFASLMRENSIIGFCYPIYGSRVPKIMREFAIKHTDILKGKKIIIFATQNVFSGDGARVFVDLFPRNHFTVILAEHFLMPNNVSNLFFYPLASEKRLEKYRNDTLAKINRMCREIKSGIYRKRGFHIISRVLGFIQGGVFPYIEDILKDRVRITKDCNQCGVCMKICPSHNFVLHENQISTRGKCFLCYRCINQCPKKAILIMFPCKARKQYKGMAIEVRSNG